MLSGLEAEHALGLLGTDDAGIPPELTANFDLRAKILPDEVNRRFGESRLGLRDHKRFVTLELTLQREPVHLDHIAGIGIGPHHQRERIVGRWGTPGKFCLHVGVRHIGKP
jgi:hypothetical protein